MFHAAHGDVELLGAGVELERERRAAAIAEGPLGAARGRDVRRRAGDEREIARPDARPGPERGCGEAPADRAVTVCEVVQRARRAPPHGAAEASTFPQDHVCAHVSSLLTAIRGPGILRVACPTWTPWRAIHASPSPRSARCSPGSEPGWRSWASASWWRASASS